ncbi:Sbal_3080 family lipoprotein [Acinetobacter haemolyticus]|uniref:Sbal_3080 family lipoprotein n=1 Tax=Acinetobacter haemolyticus TaxID=29430 RepID=UPI0002F3FF48|nr:Sbal_3080 family lipoprotein [Acinetobacter haemolyticus]NAS00128.1 hypothetical protein [Acinetobacter haemolyticus]
MKNKRLIFPLLSGILCSACSTTWQSQASPVHTDYRSQIKSICIENNPKVKIDHFQEMLINGIESYHIQTQVFNAPFKPNTCEFTLNYDAVEDYETVFFISDMTLKLYNRVGQRIGLSEYHVYRAGGLDLTKYQDNDVKINRMVDGLLNSGKK